MCRYYNGKILQAKVSAVYLPKGSCAERKRVPVTENQLQKRYNNNKDDIGYLKKMHAYYHYKQGTEYEVLEPGDTVRI